MALLTHAERVETGKSEQLNNSSAVRLILVFGRQAFASQAFSQMLQEEFPDHDIVCANSRERLAGLHIEALDLIVVTASAASNQNDLDTMSAFLATDSARPFTVILGDVGLGAKPTQAALLNLRGVFPDETAPEVVLAGLRFILAGGHYFPKDNSILEDPRKNTSSMPTSYSATSSSNAMSFTSRELAVLEALAKGLSNKAIARQLSIAENTTKIHVRGILRKLDVTNRTEAALMAQRLKLIGIS